MPLLVVMLVLIEDFHHLNSRLADWCTWSEDGSHTCFVEEVVVLGWDDTSCGDEDVLTSQFLEFCYHLRDEGLYCRFWLVTHFK